MNRGHHRVLKLELPLRREQLQGSLHHRRDSAVIRAQISLHALADDPDDVPDDGEDGLIAPGNLHNDYMPEIHLITWVKGYGEVVDKRTCLRPPGGKPRSVIVWPPWGPLL